MPLTPTRGFRARCDRPIAAPHPIRSFTSRLHGGGYRIPLGRLHCPVQRRPADLQVAGNGGDRLAARLPGAGHGQDVVIDGGVAAASSALGLGAAQPV